MSEETLEHAQMRTQEFLTLVSAEIAALGQDEAKEHFLDVARRLAPLIIEVKDHHQLREHIATCYTSLAYDYLMAKFHAPKI